jgi:glycerol uptake facilitator-like aquaporin
MSAVLLPYLAEFAGAFVLAYVILASGNAIPIGVTLLLVKLIIDRVSGGHLNPMVSIVMASAGQLPVDKVVPYILSQVAGGMIALELFKRYRVY